jgi:hypothetical protein
MEYVLIWLIGTAIGLAILYSVIHAAVRAALSDHYKTVRWYEKTGEWAPNVRSWKHAPASFVDDPS